MVCLKLVVFLTFYGVWSQETPCPKVLTVDITDGVHHPNKSIVKDEIVFDQKNYFFGENNTIHGCICNIKPCIRKCCGPGEIFFNTSCVLSNQTFDIEVHDGTEKTDLPLSHHFIHNKHCKNDSSILLPHFYSDDEFHLQANGSLYLPYYELKPMRDPEDYCLDIFDIEELQINNNVSAMLCFMDEDYMNDTQEQLTKVGMIISIPFLLATFIAYALLPDRNLHMKALMFYVINLMSSYIILVVIQLSNSRFDDLICSLLGYFCLFFFLVSFLWMNVICFDIWFTFSGLRGFSGSKKITERKRFFVYCGYAWGVPALHVLGVLAIDRWAQPSSFFHPGIGFGQCFLKQGVPELLYFHGPMAILITINIILFAITAFKIRAIKKDTTSVLKKEDSKRHSYENDKQTFNLYLKLLFAMGVNWSMEIISWAVNWAQKAPDSVWYLTDFCNAIYGVFIFFIFVFKKNIWKLLKKRYYSFIGKPHLAHSMTVSNTTRATSYSTANTMNGVTDTSTLTSEA